MEPNDEVVEVDQLERSLLSRREDYDAAGGEPVLFSASFEEAEENFVKYLTVQWILYSLLLILAWGIGVLMLIYLPVRRYVLLKDIQSRKLYLTPTAIVYKVTKPVTFPCFGALKKEKHVLLHSVADVVIEQGYLQSLFGVYSVRIENVGVRRPHGDDFQIKGVANPGAFKRAVLARLSNMRSEAFSNQDPSPEDLANLKASQLPAASMSISKGMRHDSFSHHAELRILQKLEEVGSSVKRVQTLIKEQQSQAPENII